MTTRLTPHETGARLDRLAWSPMHTTILIALGAGWLFDSFEVQMFSNAIGPLGTYFHATVFEQDAVLAVWLGGILFGALLGGRLADRFGRRRLFLWTLLWYAGFTVLTGLSPDLTAVYGLRFLAALGVGAEYAIVNAAIAEFIPARVRGKANAIVMNFWPAGAIAAGLLAFLVLDTFAIAAATSWRYLFIFGGALALLVLLFRRRIPESPRWLVSQGRTVEAQQILRSFEASCGGSAPLPLHQNLDIDQLRAPGQLGALRELLTCYRWRLVLGATLDLSEAFGYYGIFALLSVVVLHQVHISDRSMPLFYILGNLGGLIGGLIMAQAFDRVGHLLMVAITYLLAAVGVILLALATSSHDAHLVTAAFIVANAAGTAAWTSAYPTFTELFPTHLRAAGVGTSVAIGRCGAIIGTLYLPVLAVEIGTTASYSLVVGFWLLGFLGTVAYSLLGGIEPSRRSLEEVVNRVSGSTSKKGDHEPSEL
ncbi:MFS transporter [Ferrimicrobium sp.]|uniref:MFS transporter n=1 Tax=Ferrimicrobium sp. TaxID=2926050 RepID=UPI0026158900|nr:MFS transporter [Ferrimicrobium sp.]